MSITIDTNMYLLFSLFNISLKKVAGEYSGMTVEEIMKAEAEKGNSEAAKFDKEVLNNPVKLIELFQLKDPANKFAILSNMNEHDLEELLPYLNQEDLVHGLNFFTKDKLLNMAEDLPKDQLVNFTMQMFSPEQLMQFLPEEQLNNILTSTDISKDVEIKYLKTLKPEVMAQMIEAATGKPAAGTGEVGLDGKPSFDTKMLLTQLTNLPDDKFQEAMLSMPKASKQGFVLHLLNENSKLYQSVDSDAYTNIINQRKEKEDIVKASNVIEKEQLVGMLEELPQDLTAVVLTQIDTKQFADILIKNFKNILNEIVAG